MGSYSFQKGVEDGKNGNPPKPADTNSPIDYIFQTHRTEEKLKEDTEDYKRGYVAGSQQSAANAKKND